LFFYGCETWCLKLREELKAEDVPQYSAEIFVPKRKLHNDQLLDLYSSTNIIRVIKSSRIRWVRHVARMGERYVHGFRGET
jgi:hypothetical protein